MQKRGLTCESTYIYASYLSIVLCADWQFFTRLVISWERLDEAIVESSNGVGYQDSDSRFCSSNKTKFFERIDTDESVKFFCPSCRLSQVKGTVTALQHELQKSALLMARLESVFKQLQLQKQEISALKSTISKHTSGISIL